jgi:glucose/mannose-6-phosphate isomerase
MDATPILCASCLTVRGYDLRTLDAEGRVESKYGGALSSEISYGRDGGSTAIKLLNILKNSNGTLAELYDSLPRLYLSRQKVDCAFNKYSQVLEAVRQRYESKRIDDTDGLKVFLEDDDWILFRGSGNSPEFKVFAQSGNEVLANKLGNEGIALVKSVITKHQAPSGLGQDSKNVFAAMSKFPEQVAQVLTEMPLQHVPTSCNLVSNIVVSGMGGSALGGRILASLERQILRVPIVISSEYHLPNFVNEKTLVVVSSYSGNTEETLTSLNEAIARNAQIFVIASGGKLAKIALERKLPNYIFEPRFNTSGQPRLGLGYNVMALVSLLSRCQLINPPAHISDLAPFLKEQQLHSQKLAQEIAQQIQGRIPIIFASEHLKGVAYDFRNQLNENSKNMAAYFDLPEANHHLLEGLSYPSSNVDNLIGVFISSSKYHPEVQKRYPITSTVLSKQKVKHLTISAVGENSFFECMYLVQLSSYISFYVSQLNGTDPGPIPWVDYFKEEISK